MITITDAIFSDPSESISYHLEELGATFHLRPINSAFLLELEEKGLAGEGPKTRGKTKKEKRRIFEQQIEKKVQLFMEVCTGWDDFVTGSGAEIPYREEICTKLIDMKCRNKDGALTTVADLILDKAFTLGTEQDEELEGN